MAWAATGVVMAAIADVPQPERAAARARAVASAGLRWIEAQGARCGFAIPGPPGEEDEDDESGAIHRRALRVTDYRTLRVDHRGPTARIGVLDLEGILEVRDPERFVAALARGFGRAKAFGCGLMLVRRVASRVA